MEATFEQERIHEIFKQSPQWYRNPNLIKLYLLLIAPMLTSTSWGFDLSMTNGLQSVDRFMDNFGNPTGATLGFYGACMSVGGLVACIIGGPLSDKYGRRLLCFVGSLLVLGMALMQTFSTSFGMFTGGKLLLGLGSNLQQCAAPVLVTELAHPNQRLALSSIYNSSIFIGLIIGSWITFATYSMDSDWAWKLPCILQIMLPAYQTVMIWFCPESPRWLVSKGRSEEAQKIIAHYHTNGVIDDVVRAEMQEIMAGIQADQTLIKPSIEGFKSMFGTKGNLHRLWICFWTAVGSQCLGSGIIASYLPIILDQVGMTTSKDKTLINGIQSILNWLFALGSAIFVIPRIGRRVLFLISTSGMLAAFIVWTGLSATYINTGKSSYGIGVVVMIFVYNVFSASCWIPMVIAYPLETLTTKQRATFFAFTMFTINASAFVISYINPIGMENLTWRYYIIQTCFIAAFLLLVYFTFVETKNLTLEEIATIFDGKEDFANAVNSVTKEKETELIGRDVHLEMIPSKTA